MADGTAVTALGRREEPPPLARSLCAFTETEMLGGRAAEAPGERRRERVTLLTALLASLAVHTGALAGVLILSAQFAPVPLPVAGLISVGIVASEGSIGSLSSAVEDVSAGARAEQAPSSVEIDSAAIPTAVLAAATATPPIEALELPESEAIAKPVPLLESLTEITEEARLPVVPAIAPSPDQPSPQALLFESTEPKRLQAVSQPVAAPTELRAAKTPPLPSRKPNERQLAQLEVEKSAPSSAKPQSAQPTENEQLAAAVPRHGPRQSGETSDTRGEGAANGGQAAGDNDTSGGGSGNGGTGSSPRFSGQGLSNPPPRYPHLARQRGQEGQVVIRVRVSADGNARSVTVRRSSGYPLLDDAAATAIRRWQFVPASLAGIAMAGTVDVPVTFKLTE